MRRRMVKIAKVGLIFSLTTVLSLILVYKVMAAPTNDEFLLRVEVQNHSENVSISAPLALLNTLFNLLPKDVLRLCNETNLTPERITKELTSLKGEDVVRITGGDNVRVWLEPVTPQNEKDLGFVKVHVKEGRNNGDEINVCVPRGLVQLAGQIAKSLGLVDRYVKLPPEITQLKVIEKQVSNQEADLDRPAR